MPYRKIVFANNEIYHVLNRGVAQAPIFLSTKTYLRFLGLLDFYRFANPTISYSHFTRLSTNDKEKFMGRLRKQEKLVEIFAYCLIPNHFHLLIKQLLDGGVPKMISNLQNGYARYFNLKYKRPGPLFQSIFKAIRIETDEQFLHVSRYIHLNPNSSLIIKTEKLVTYPWSSLPEYLRDKPAKFVNPKPLLTLVGGRKKYRKFVFDQAEYQKELDKIKHLTLENP